MNSWITLAVLLAGITQCIRADVEVVYARSTTCTDYGTRNTECTMITYPNMTQIHRLVNIQSMMQTYDDVVNIVYGTYNLTQICAEELSVVKSVSKCLVNSYRQCADNDFKTLIPTADQYSSAIDYVCNNQNTITSINKCFETTISSITDCTENKQARQTLTDGAKPARSDEFSKFTQFHCGRRTIDLECKKVDEDFLECSSQDYTIYEELMSKIKPEPCSGVNGLMYTTSLLLVSVFSLLHRYL